MNIPFSLGVYLLIGLLVVVWLARQDKIAAGLGTRAWAVVFWPAYLVVCLGPAETKGGGRDDATLAGLADRIRALPVDESRRKDYVAALDRISSALDGRVRELERLLAVQRRLTDMAGTLGDGPDKKIVRDELERVAATQRTIEADLQKARAQVIGLAVRVEVFAVRAPRESLDEQLAAFEEDLDRLLHAQAEVA